MSHSKRNTSLAFFTAHERAELKGTWGSRSTRLTRDSFLPFGCCQLCLLPAREPVACGSGGHLFCRECALSNLLAQNAELKRTQRAAQLQQSDAQRDADVQHALAQERAVREFELLQEGLEGRGPRGDAASRVRGMGAMATVIGNDKGWEREHPTERPASEAVIPAGAADKSTKRKHFQLDPSDVSLAAADDHDRAKRLLLSEQRSAAKDQTLPSFWVPSETPNRDATGLSSTAPAPTTTTICPASTPGKQHDFTLKTLITVHFHHHEIPTPPSTTSPTPATCPSCTKPLTNATKAILAKPCGHVLCKPCSAKFQRPADELDTINTTTLPSDAPDRATVHCYVCSEDVTPGRAVDALAEARKKDKDKKKHKKPKDRPTRGLVELSSEGTGFAGGGGNMVTKSGLAFQC